MVCMYVCMYVSMYVCTYVRMYVCMYVCECMSVCMHVCMSVYVHMIQQQGRRTSWCCTASACSSSTVCTASRHCIRTESPSFSSASHRFVCSAVSDVISAFAAAKCCSSTYSSPHRGSCSTSNNAHTSPLTKKRACVHSCIHAHPCTSHVCIHICPYLYTYIQTYSCTL